MSPLIARRPEPLTEDPFAGGNAASSLPSFDGERFTANGATDDEVLTLAEHFATLSRNEARETSEWLSEAPDADIVAWLEQWRTFAADAEAEAALIDGTVDEVLDRVRAAADEERLELAERTLAAEQNRGDDADRSTLIEGLEQLIAQEEARAAQRAADESGGTSTPPEGVQAADGTDSGGGGAPDATSE